MKTQNQKIGQKGAAAVEFAIVLPLLVTLVFGIIEFSILFYNKAMLTNASREGARFGIVYVPDRASDLATLNVDITKKVKDYCEDYLITFGGGSLTVPTPLWSGTDPGSSLTVTAKYDYDFLVLPNFIPSLIDFPELEAVTVMRLE